MVLETTIFYVDRKQGYRLSSAILHVYDTGYIRVEAISQEVNNENCYVLWTNNSYPQNKKNLAVILYGSKKTSYGIKIF